jgi:hypothetical protein
MWGVALQSMAAFVFGCTWPEEDTKIISLPRFLLTGNGYDRDSTAEYLAQRLPEDPMYLTPSYPTARFYAMSSAERKYDRQLDTAFGMLGGRPDAGSGGDGSASGGTRAPAIAFNDTRIYYNGFIHMVQIVQAAGMDAEKRLLNVGLRSTIYDFLKWCKRTMGEEKLSEVQGYTFIAYGVKVKGRRAEPAPYDVKDHLLAWAAAAKDLGFSDEDVDRHKREVVKQGIKNAVGAVSCVRASLLEVDVVVHKALIKYAKTLGCRGIGSYELPCITTVPLHAVRAAFPGVHGACSKSGLIALRLTDGLGTVRAPVPLPRPPVSRRGGGERRGRGI